MHDQPQNSKHKGLPPLPMDDATWRGVAERLGLSAQQLRIVALILRDCQDKRIAAELGIAVSTLRSHLERIHGRLHTSGRTGLILHVFKAAQAVRVCPACGQ